MKNNQNNTKNTVYQYTVTADSNIKYDTPKPVTPNIKTKVVKTNTYKNSSPALSRAMKALKLINPFKGV